MPYRGVFPHKVPLIRSTRLDCPFADQKEDDGKSNESRLYVGVNAQR